MLFAAFLFFVRACVRACVGVCLCVCVCLFFACLGVFARGLRVSRFDRNPNT